MNDHANTTAVCPGTYDPVTEGHLDIIRRASELFERVIVGVVSLSPRKDTMFSAEERVSFLEDSLSGEAGNIEVVLLIHCWWILPTSGARRRS